MIKFARLVVPAIAVLALMACGKQPVDEEKTAELIQPVGRVEMAGAASASTPEAGGAPKSGEEIVQTVCTACHGAGLLNSPKIGDKAAWGPRIAQGVETLYKSALEGKNAMPARGGNPALSDAEIKSAVDYLVKQAK
ncbi:MAG: putative cytochrome c5 [Proteobacteria bacterium]|nr:putative cytochrome c5 [Pseudomonadota bacterium]